jgi:hypothetical protein
MANKPQDIPTATLRDTLLIWLFATARKETLDGIKRQTISSKDLLKMLEDQGSIKVGDKDNKKTCTAVCAAILANPDEFGTIQNALVSIPVLARGWTGGPIHPQVEELRAILVPLSANEIRKSNQVRKRRGLK